MFLDRPSISHLFPLLFHYNRSFFETADAPTDKPPAITALLECGNNPQQCVSVEIKGKGK